MTKTSWKTLYKQNTNGSIQQWTISVQDNDVISVYGLVNGALQTALDTVREGKNLGRSNATTPESQALLQAQQAYDGKLKEGYVPSLATATTTKNTLGAIEPMLAHPIDKKEKYVVFPALAQPKLDGIRCLAIMKHGKVQLFSRTQKEFLTVPHIVQEIEEIWGHLGNLILDGELYNHRFKTDFNRITSIIKRDDVHKDHKLVQYHIYDTVAPGGYEARTAFLKKDLVKAEYCIPVETVRIDSRDMLEQYQVDCIDRGYEGCMYRNLKGMYEHKRSSGLLKVKTFQDAEFKIVDMEEGHGKLMGKVGAFYCQLPGGKTFRASPLGSHELLQEYWDRKKYCIGKMATVKFQNYTPDGVPRFPKLKCIRDYD